VAKRSLEEARSIEEMVRKKVLLRDEIRSYAVDPLKRRNVSLLPNIPLALRRLLASPASALASATGNATVSPTNPQMKEEAASGGALSDINFVQKTTEDIKREKILEEQRMAAADSASGAADMPAQHELIKNGRFGPDIAMFSIPLPAIFPISVSRLYLCTHRHADRHTDRHTDRQTNTHIHLNICSINMWLILLYCCSLRRATRDLR
jgi:hypothetical protein